LNYSTRIVFKSSKVVPTMILGTVLQGRRYDMQEYAAAALLVAGVSLFCLGDVAVAPNFHIAGVGLITLALFADAATSNFEEKRFFRIANPVSQAEVIFYSSALSSIAGFAVLLPTRELGPAWEHSRANSVVVPLLSAAAVCGYLRYADALSAARSFCAEAPRAAASPLSCCSSSFTGQPTRRSSSRCARCSPSRFPSPSTPSR
jgi:adenosine 3'-phospho 5'-phosphosulfate transporter B3